MKPAPFSYAAPATLDECVELLARHGDDAKLLAGGQSLVPLLNLRLAVPEIVIDLNRIGGLGHVSDRGDHLAVGALTRTRVLVESGVVARACPMLPRAASLVGYPAIRARGTVGGSLAHAHPASELPLAAVALDAELDAVGPAGRRTVPARDFFTGVFSTDLDPREVLVEIRFPRQRAGEGWSFQEASRKSGDFAQAAVAVVLAVADGAVARAAIAVAGVGDRPRRAEAVEDALVGRLASGQALALAADDVVAELAPDPGDADLSYRRHLVGVLTRRALADAAQTAGGPS